MDRYNEYILTSLRTMWGCNLNEIAEAFRDHFLSKAQSFLESGMMIEEKGNYRLTGKGMLIADRLSMELFLDEFQSPE